MRLDQIVNNCDPKHFHIDIKTFDTGLNKIITKGGYVLRQEKTGNDCIFRLAPSGKNTSSVGQLTASQIKADAEKIWDLYEIDHTHVKYRDFWKVIYRGKLRPLLFCENSGRGGSENGNTQLSGSRLTYPCAYCGIVLPEELIQVDHRQPQKEPDVAVMKVIRGIGDNRYASEMAQGQKAVQVGELLKAVAVQNWQRREADRLEKEQADQMQMDASDWMQTDASNQGKPNNDDPQPPAPTLTSLTIGKHKYGKAFLTKSTAEDKNVKKRYTLTSEGEIFLTVCCRIWSIHTLYSYCLNSALNLVPSCAACNGGKGKHSKIYQTPNSRN